MPAPHPRPAPTAPFPEFWSFCAQGELRLQRCASCGTWRYPPAPVCAACNAREASWEPVSGRGTVHTYTWCHPPVLPAFADSAPYNAVVVELEEGPMLVSNVEDVGPDDLHVGLPVEVTFVTVDDDFVLPRFRPRP